VELITLKSSMTKKIPIALNHDSHRPILYIKALLDLQMLPIILSFLKKHVRSECFLNLGKKSKFVYSGGYVF